MEPYHAAQLQPLAVVPPVDAADPAVDPAAPLVADIVPLAITIERRLLTDRWRTLPRRMQLNMGSRRGMRH